MRTVRSFTKNPLVILVLLIAFLNLSCNQDEMIEDQINNKISGEELFKSIIFADGLLTKEIVPLANLQLSNKMSVSQLEEYRLLQIEAINYISKSKAGFFDVFKENILSKNPDLINKAINDAGTLLIPFINQKLKANNISYEEVYNNAKDIKTNSGNLDDFQYGKSKSSQSVCIYGAVVLAIVAAAAVALVVVGFGFWWAKTDANNLENSIVKDEIILGIVNL